jgi:excisionase family DNA binding protein
MTKSGYISRMSIFVQCCPILAILCGADPITLEKAMATTASKPQLLKVGEAAALLKVSEKTIRRWIEAEAIPYLKLPSGSYRIPQGALLASLRGNYDLGRELRELDERNANVTDEQVLAALSED